MAVKSREFVGIAEGIRKHELSTRGQIESLKGHMMELSGRKSSLNSTISCLEAAIAAAYEDTDEDGDPDYGRIAALEAQKSSVEDELSNVEADLDDTGSKLESKENELEAVEEEKAQTLFEIQERARRTSQNISFSGGTIGAFAGTSMALQASLNTSLSALSQAAGILGGSVDGASGGSSGHSSSRGGGSKVGGSASPNPGDGSSSAVMVFTAGTSDAMGTVSASKYETSQDGHTPSVVPSFGNGSRSIKTKPVQNFNSGQSENGYASYAFSAAGNDGTEGSSQGVVYESAQQSAGAYNNFAGMSEQDEREEEAFFKKKTAPEKPTEDHIGNEKDRVRAFKSQYTAAVSGKVTTSIAASGSGGSGDPSIDARERVNRETGDHDERISFSFRRTKRSSPLPHIPTSGSTLVMSESERVRSFKQQYVVDIGKRVVTPVASRKRNSDDPSRGELERERGFEHLSTTMVGGASSSAINQKKGDRTVVAGKNVNCNQGGGRVVPIPGEKIFTPIPDVQTLLQTKQIIRKIRHPDGTVTEVFDHPEKLQKTLPYKQGNNERKKCGTCGLANTAVMLKIAGSRYCENDIVNYASSHSFADGTPLCSVSGGTTAPKRVAVWNAFGVEATVHRVQKTSVNSMIERIGEAIESGRAVSVGVNAGELWSRDNLEGYDLGSGSDSPFGDGGSNHVIGVVSCERNPSTGEITFVHINDTGRGLKRDACRRVPVADFIKAFAVDRATACISNEAIW